MTATITLFGQLNPPTATGAQLDDMFLLAAEQATVPCTVSGTNALTLTQESNVVTISAYTNNMQLSGIAAATNTAAATAALGSLTALNIYKDTPSGPALLTGGEIVGGNAFTLLYDPVLNANAGGWHLFTSTAITSAAIAPASVRVNGNSTLTNWLSGTASLSFSATPANSSNDLPFSVTGIPSVLPHVGDFVEIVPPSLAVAGIVFQAMVLSVGSLTASTSVATINARALNVTGASVNPPYGIYRYLAKRSVP